MDIALEQTLARGAAALDVDLDRTARRQLLDYLALLARWNKRFNLTAVSEPASMVTRHLLDALAVLGYVRGPRVLDVGSGAGVPGLVLAVASPSLTLTLLDPSLKRTRFLTQAVHTLGVHNVRIVRARIESLTSAEGYDTVISRATMAADRLAQAARPLLTDGGQVVAMLGRADGRLRQALGEGWRLRLVALSVPGLDAERHLACMRPCDPPPQPFSTR